MCESCEELNINGINCHEHGCPEAFPRCACGGRIEYRADLAAPGVGSVWECSKCEAVYHKRGSYFNLMEDVNPNDLTTHEFDDNEHNGIL